MGVTTEQLTILKEYVNNLVYVIGDRFGLDITDKSLPEITQMVRDYQFIDSSAFTAEEVDVRFGKTFGARGEALAGEMPNVNSTTITSAEVTETNKTLRLYQENVGYLDQNTKIYVSIKKLNEIVNTFYTQEQLCSLAYNGGITGEQLKQYIDNLTGTAQPSP